jgi:hypothetical protein
VLVRKGMAAWVKALLAGQITLHSPPTASPFQAPRPDHAGGFAAAIAALILSLPQEDCHG